MANDWFRFREFLVEQDQCAMKVGTDSILLGAWCGIENCSNILDIGTGTGIIALMCAQRSSASVFGIEIDQKAAEQSKRNFAQSPWPDRLTLINGDIRDSTALPLQKFDLLVCNPPYFADSLLSRDKDRNKARHNTTLNLNELIISGIELISRKGKICLILPPDRFEEIEQSFDKKNLKLIRKTTVSSRPGTRIIRVMAEWAFIPKKPVISHLNIYKENSNEYHPEFDSLTKAFYL